MTVFERSSGQHMVMTEKSTATTKKIRRRLFLYLAAALLLLAAGLVTIISFTLFDRLEKAETNSLTHICEIRSISISQWCRRAKDIARQITSRTRIMQELERYNHGQISYEKLNAFTTSKLSDAMRFSDEVVGIVRLDQKNQIISECGFDLSFCSYNVTDFLSDEVEIFIPCSEINCSNLVVSAPIFNEVGERQGTDLVIFDTSDLKKIITSFDQLGETSAIVVGYKCSICPKEHDAPLLVTQKENSNLSPIELFEKIRVPIEKAIAKKKGFTSLDKLVVASHPIDECDWGLAITQNKEELYSHLYGKIITTYVMSFFVYIFILYGFWFLMRPLAGKMLLHASELEEKIKEKTAILERQIAERKKAEAEKEKTIIKLQEATQKIKILGGLIPICASCKKIRDDKGYWCRIESYISEHSEADFSHGICPDCLKKLYPEFSDENENLENKKL